MVQVCLHLFQNNTILEKELRQLSTFFFCDLVGGDKEVHKHTQHTHAHARVHAHTRHLHACARMHVLKHARATMRARAGGASAMRRSRCCGAAADPSARECRVSRTSGIWS